MPIKLKFIIASLSSCSGCILALMALDIFPQFLERVEFNYFPFISDKNEIEDADIALVEGCVSEDTQVEFLKSIRKNVKKLYALGTCAAFGGILSLSKKKDANPISEFVEVDDIIPGCPPPPNLLGSNLIRLIENKSIKLSEKNMCDSCPLKDEINFNFKTQIHKILPSNSEFNSKNSKYKCFLNNGILCLGIITREGCEHKCMNYGLPCEGCLGSPTKKFVSNLINFLSLFPLSNDLKRYSGIFYRFSKPIIKRKR